MLRTTAAGLLLALVAVSGSRPAGAGESDEAAIHALADDFVDAWNRHDPKAMAAFWAEDGDLVNPWGRIARGRAEVEKLLLEGHGERGLLRATTLRLARQELRLVTADVAVCDWTTTVSGALATDGATLPAFEERVTVVVRKSAGGWACVAARAGRRDPLLSADPVEPSEPRLVPPAMGPRERSIDKVRTMLMYFLGDGAGLSKSWPMLDGKGFVLSLVAKNAIDRRDPRTLDVLFSPGDSTRSLEKAGGVKAYDGVTFDALKSGHVDLGPLTSYAGRRNRQKAHLLDSSELVKGAPVLADLSFEGGAIVGFTTGAVRWMTRAELGVPEGQPITVGDDSASELLRHLSDR